MKTSLWLPHSNEENENDYANLDVKHFSMHRLETNLKILNKIDIPAARGLDPDEQIEMLWMRDYFNQAYKEYKGILRQLPKMKDIRDILAPHATFLSDSKSWRIPKLTEALTKRLGESPVGEKIVAWGDSHALSHATARALKAHASKRKIGYVIFDAHVDTYDVKKHFWKGNPFAHALNRKEIERVLIVGPHWQVTEGAINDHLPDLPRRIADRINILEHRARPADALGVSLQTFYDILRVEIVDMLKEVDTIIVSIDVDGFESRRLKLTGMEYNPMHSLTYLANAITPAKLRKLRTTQVYDLLHFLDGPKSRYLNESFHGRDNLLLNGQTIFDGSLSEEAGHGAIKLIKQITTERKAQFGLPLPNGGRFCGEIFEMAGPDYQGRTAKLVRKFTNILQSVCS